MNTLRNFSIENPQVKETRETDRYYIKELILELQELCTLLRKQEKNNPHLNDYKVNTIEETPLAVESDDNIHASNSKIIRKEASVNTETKYTDRIHKADNCGIRESASSIKNDYIPSMACDTIKNHMSYDKINCLKKNKYKCLEYLESKLKELTLLRHTLDLNIETQYYMDKIHSSGDIRANLSRINKQSGCSITEDKSQITDKLPRQLQEILTLKEQVNKLKKENIRQKKKIMNLQQFSVVDADRENNGTEIDDVFLKKLTDRVGNDNLKASCFDIAATELQDGKCSFSINNEIWNVDDYNSDNFCSISISKEYAQIGSEIQCRPVVVIKPSLIKRKIPSYVECSSKNDE